MNSKWNQFKQEVNGKKIAICGVGKNNLPVIYQFLEFGAKIFACDKRTEEQLGETAKELKNAGVTLFLGDEYLDHLEGMNLILRTPGMKPYLSQINKAREQGVIVTSEMELFFDFCPAPIYAVTGSDGKTTTTTIIAGLLEKTGKKVFLGGNIGRPLLPLIEGISKTDVAVVELSSFQLTLMKKAPHVAVVTNVAPNHLDWHTDMQEYIDAKYNLIAYQGENDRTVLNLDNKVTAEYGKKAPAGEVLYFSRKQRPENGTYLDSDGNLCYAFKKVDTILLSTKDIKIPGVHNVENYLAAIAAVWGEVNPKDIKEYAQNFGGVAHRSELIRTLKGVRWYNDSIGSSPSRTIAGLQSFDRKVILIAGGYDKHIPYTPLGPVAKETVKEAILMGATADAIEKAIQDCSDLPIHRVSGMEEAVKVAYSIAKEGDIVFMSPASASFDMYRNFEERGNHFRSLVEKL